jgi:hypothetical protein
MPGKPVDDKPVVLLYNLCGVGLIIPWPSGVIYQGQVGGHYCLPFREEGIFVPLEFESFDQARELHEFFTGPKWGGWCGEGIDDQTADFIDQSLARIPLYEEGFIKVDRSRLWESVEAWIYVDVQEEPCLTGLTPCKAILTWPNSD